jgi:hypothetical protein
MRQYEVTVSISFTETVSVEAEDEFRAALEAQDPIFGQLDPELDFRTAEIDVVHLEDVTPAATPSKAER